MDITPSNVTDHARRRVLMYVVAAAAGAAAAAHWAIRPAVAFDHEDSWVQIAQGCCYFLGMVVAAVTVWRLRRAGRDEWAVVALIACGMVFLTLREFEPDDLIFGVHMFSFNYLTKHKIPLSTKLAMGIPGLSILATLAWWMWRRRKLLTANLGTVLRRKWTPIFAAGAFLVIVCQILDRAESIKRRLGIELPGLYEKDKLALRNVEECLELAAAVLMLCAMIELTRNLRSPRRS